MTHNHNNTDTPITLHIDEAIAVCEARGMTWSIGTQPDVLTLHMTDLPYDDCDRVKLDDVAEAIALYRRHLLVKDCAMIEATAKDYHLTTVRDRAA